MNEEPWDSKNIPPVVQTALVFAARYTHDRPTGGALEVRRALELCWAGLSEHTKDQVVRESNEATCNQDDWEQMRKFAVEHE